MAGEWRTTPFHELLDGPVRNGIYKPKQFHGRGAKVVNMGELFAYPRLRAVPMKRIEVSEDETRRFSLSSGDLLFARRSLVAEGAGKCSLVLEVEDPTVFESSIIRARPESSKADSLFLYYFFNSPNGLYHLDTIRRQVAVAGITGKDLSALEITIPTLPEQRAIAHIFGTLDDKIELNRQMSQTLEEMARALFKSWFVDFDPVRAKAAGRKTGLPKKIADLFPSRFVESEIGEIPEGWEANTIDAIASLNPQSWSKKTRPTGINYVDLSNTKWGRIESVVRYQESDAPSRAQRVLRPGDTIVGTVRPGNGSYAYILDNDLTGSTGFAVLRPLKDDYAEFIYLAATAADNIGTLSHLADGGAYPAVRPEVVAATPIVCPNDEVLRRFSLAAGSLLQKMSNNEQESNALAALRDALLPKLISGELRVNDCERFLEEQLL